MKVLFLFIFLSFNILAIDNVASSEKPRVFLEKLSKYAIRVGSGDLSKVYMFVDPMCKHSKRVITKLFESNTLQRDNSYYIFLYRLEKFESDKLNQYIYQSDNPKDALEEVMVFELDVDLDEFVVLPETIKALNEIERVGEKLEITRRPYLIVFDKGSDFCRVSEGTASCIEGF